MNRIYQRGDRRYRARKVQVRVDEWGRVRGRKQYELATWCNCTFGPHWHVHSYHSTVADLEAELDVIEEQAT